MTRLGSDIPSPDSWGKTKPLKTAVVIATMIVLPMARNWFADPMPTALGVLVSP